MATNTPNYELVKPSDTEVPDIAVINGNMDKIDLELKANADNIGSLQNTRSISYDFGNIQAETLQALVNALIAKFQTCADGAHSYYGTWAGNWYFGGTIHKRNWIYGVMSFYPGTVNVPSMVIYDSGAGWNSTNLN